MKPSVSATLFFGEWYEWFNKPGFTNGIISPKRRGFKVPTTRVPSIGRRWSVLL